MNCNSSLKNFVAVFVLVISVVIISGEPECEELPVIRNGSPILEDRNVPFSVNTSISYECDEGYKTDELRPTVTCRLRDNIANWTEGACKERVIGCNDPGHIDNGRRFGLLFSFPHNVTYVCNDGYKIIGPRTRYCSVSGTWQPRKQPECEEILCPLLMAPTNGEVLPSNRRPDSIAVYTCGKYYKLVGDAQRTCQNDGTWSGTNPSCEKITCTAPKFSNGHIIGLISSVYNASDIIILQCNDGTHRVSAKCTEIGEWSVRPPTCIGPSTVESTTVATTVASEYPSKTLSTVTRGEPEHFSTLNVKKLNSCEDPGPISNGVRNIEGLHINGTVTYTCDEGYNLEGQSTLLCLENGKWNLRLLPMCVKPLSYPAVIGIVFGVIAFIFIVLGGGYLYYKYRMKHIRGYGEKSKALTADATDIDEIAGLEKDRTRIPVTVL